MLSSRLTPVFLLITFSVVEKRSADAFSIFSNNSATAKSISRKTFLNDLGVVLGTLLVPTAANADITNKLSSSSALRSVKLSQKKLAAMEDFILMNDCVPLKEALRVQPFSDIRKSCTTLIQGGEDGPDAEELQKRYKTFIANLEKLDSTASLGMRGRKLADGEFLTAYKAVVDALSDFVTIAEEAAAIPVQYEGGQASS